MNSLPRPENFPASACMEFAAGALELLHELTPENAEMAASRQNSLPHSLPAGKTRTPIRPPRI
jgi:hypothetical protein